MQDTNLKVFSECAVPVIENEAVADNFIEKYYVRSGIKHDYIDVISFQRSAQIRVECQAWFRSVIQAELLLKKQQCQYLRADKEYFAMWTRTSMQISPFSCIVRKQAAAWFL